MRENVSEEDPPPWVNVQYNIFLRNRKVFLDEKLLKKLWMTPQVIRDRDFIYFLSASVASV